jgi:polysaccharide pyruvyl transferase WcaK-like protein
MQTLFCVRPATRNIGNDLINRATSELLAAVFGADTAIVNIPALGDAHPGGLTKAQVYDMNRLADGVVVGGGNLFENGQLTVDPQALEALHVPLMLIGIGHGRIYDAQRQLVDRTDSMPPDVIRQLAQKASVVLVRDRSSRRRLEDLGIGKVELGGCPTLFMAPNAPDQAGGGRILVSIRNPARMSVPPELQWRVADDVRRLLGALEAAYGTPAHLVCHDYRDLEFAKAFPQTPLLYFDDVDRYVAALRQCRLSVSYRLHAFLPCLAFGTPSIHVSYDERGKEMVATAGMAEWDIDLTAGRDVVAAVMQHAVDLKRYRDLRSAAQPALASMKATSLAGIRRFADEVSGHFRQRAVA